MTITRLQYFVEAAKCENFTQAARNLYIAQPNLSRQISLLEAELGVKLFIRANRAVRLTPAGRYLYNCIRDLPAAIEAALEQTKAMGRAAAGRISIGVLEGQEINDILLARIRKFAERNPAPELLLERNSFRNLRQGLMNGHYNIIATLSFEVDSMPGVCHRSILRQPGAIAINRKNPKSMREELSLAELKDEKFVSISPEESPGGYNSLLRQCANFGFKPNIVRMTSSLESLLLCVEAGIGVALLDRNTRLEKSENVRIITIPNSDPVDLSIVWRKDDSSPLLDDLVKALSSDREI